MWVRIVVIGSVFLIIAIISVISIVVSTSKGSEWSETVWKSLDGDPDGSAPGPDEDRPENTP